MGDIGTNSEVTPEPVETDFAAALLMIAGLPLLDVDKAEAVRRLLKDAVRPS